MRIWLCIWTTAWITLLTTAVTAKELPPIQMHSGWVTFKNVEVRDGFKIFRRYGYTDDKDNPIPNLMMFNCSKDISKAASHLTFILPKGFEPDSFPRSTWLPKIDVRVLINDRLSVQMFGEYRAGEFYIDLNPDTRDNFDNLMLADTLAIGFGDKNDIIRFQFTDRFDDFFAEWVQETKPEEKIGKLSRYARGGVGSIGDACKEYQEADGQSDVKGPEFVLIALFSTVAALEIDCNFKPNQRELQRLARLHRFKLDDFSSSGRFSQEMRAQTERFREFIRNKGCRALRPAVTRNFPKIAK